VDKAQAGAVDFGADFPGVQIEVLLHQACEEPGVVRVVTNTEDIDVRGSRLSSNTHEQHSLRRALCNTVTLCEA
jgi:hypothetical protein